MTKIKNLVGSPFDVQTLSGPAIIEAFGTLEAEFEPGYLELLLTCRNIVLDEPEEQQPAVDTEAEQELEPEVEQEAEEPQPEPEADIEVDAADAEPAAEAEAVSEHPAEEEPIVLEPVSDADKYMALAGKKPDGRWSAERLAGEISKLEA